LQVIADSGLLKRYRRYQQSKPQPSTEEGIQLDTLADSQAAGDTERSRTTSEESGKRTPQTSAGKFAAPRMAQHHTYGSFYGTLQLHFYVK
jgi:hypothetical protein